MDRVPQSSDGCSRWPLCDGGRMKRARGVQVYIGKGYVNNPRVHDVVFMVEDSPFYAHKLALSASSETFRAMFDSGCLEGGTGIPEIQIPNMSRRVFEAMMMFVYTGEAGISEHLDILPELLQACPPPPPLRSIL